MPKRQRWTAGAESRRRLPRSGRAASRSPDSIPAHPGSVLTAAPHSGRDRYKLAQEPRSFSASRILPMTTFLVTRWNVPPCLRLCAHSVEMGPGVPVGDEAGRESAGLLGRGRGERDPLPHALKPEHGPGRDTARAWTWPNPRGGVAESFSGISDPAFFEAGSDEETARREVAPHDWSGECIFRVSEPDPLHIHRKGPDIQDGTGSIIFSCLSVDLWCDLSVRFESGRTLRSKDTLCEEIRPRLISGEPQGKHVEPFSWDRGLWNTVMRATTADPFV